MSRFNKKYSNKYNGVLLLDKPPKWTSHDLVQKVRNVFEQRKVGHCGTLDPMATGLMVLVLGKACSLSSDLTRGDKTYEAQIQLGLETDTLDLDGKVLKRKEVHLSLESLTRVLQESVGEKLLKVPSFSAQKVRGKKLYEYARKGKDVPVLEKQMKFYNLKINSLSSNQIQCQISCSKGSFVRAWACLIGEKTGVGACLSGLKRLESQPYLFHQVHPSLSLEGIRQCIDRHENIRCWIPYEETFFQLVENKLVQST